MSQQPTPTGLQSEVREYRHSLTSAGQSSPPWLGKRVARLLEKKFTSNPTDRLSVIDVGCGLGHQMQLIARSLPGLFSTIEGIDWSPATVEKHNSALKSVYSRVTLCHSGELPFGNKEFDIALSMENIEHLYARQSIDAIKEMARIAKYVIITTPQACDCINFNWIYPEIVQAINDPIPLTERDFICLESAVHKSTVFSASMKPAGFSIEAKSHGVFFGKSSDIDTRFIECVGMEQEHLDAWKLSDSSQVADFKWIYVTTLGKSAKLHERIMKHPLYADLPASIRLKRGIYVTLSGVYRTLPKSMKIWLKSLLGR